MRPLNPDEKTDDDLAAEWDQAAALRLQQIETGIDLSYRHILLPEIERLAVGANLTSVLDVGCGVGVLASKLSSRADRIVGVDLSSECIRVARQRFNESANVSFENCRVEDFITERRIGTFSLAIANMALMTTLALQPLLRATALALMPGGRFIFTITHPCFWPQYWEYNHAPWFNYMSEIAIEAPFRISRDGRSGIVTTHVHRPLQTYITSLRTAGFAIDDLSEPMPSEDVAKHYPTPWHFPRFLAGRCLRREEA